MASQVLKTAVALAVLSVDRRRDDGPVSFGDCLVGSVLAVLYQPPMLAAGASSSAS